MTILTAMDVSKYLKLSVPKVYALIKDGTIPSIRVGGSIRVVQEDLEKSLRGGDSNDDEGN